VDHVVDDRELRVQLRRLVLVHLDMAPEQPAVAVPRSGDRRIIVGLGRSNDPRPASPPEPSDPP